MIAEQKDASENHTRAASNKNVSPKMCDLCRIYREVALSHWPLFHPEQPQGVHHPSIIYFTDEFSSLQITNYPNGPLLRNAVINSKNKSNHDNPRGKSQDKCPESSKKFENSYEQQQVYSSQCCSYQLLVLNDVHVRTGHNTFWH